MKRNSIAALMGAVSLLTSLCVFTGGCAQWPTTTRLELVVYELLQAGYKARAGRAASEAQVAEHVRPKRSDP